MDDVACTLKVVSREPFSNTGASATQSPKTSFSFKPIVVKLPLS